MTLTMLWVSLAGGAGAAARFVADGVVNTGRSLRFPWATVGINVTGSLLLGLLTGLVLFDGAPNAPAAIAGAGFCGGFTTFSTASVETVRLMQARRYAAGFANVFGTLAAAAAAAAAGLGIAGAV